VSIVNLSEPVPKKSFSTIVYAAAEVTQAARQAQVAHAQINAEIVRSRLIRGLRSWRPKRSALPRRRRYSISVFGAMGSTKLARPLVVWVAARRDA
jgi:hypothetical protein